MFVNNLIRIFSVHVHIIHTSYISNYYIVSHAIIECCHALMRTVVNP